IIMCPKGIFFQLCFGRGYKTVIFLKSIVEFGPDFTAYGHQIFQGFRLSGLQVRFFYPITVKVCLLCFFRSVSPAKIVYRTIEDNDLGLKLHVKSANPFCQNTVIADAKSRGARCSLSFDAVTGRKRMLPKGLSADNDTRSE